MLDAGLKFKKINKKYTFKSHSHVMLALYADVRTLNNDLQDKKSVSFHPFSLNTLDAKKQTKLKHTFWTQNTQAHKSRQIQGCEPFPRQQAKEQPLLQFTDTDLILFDLAR